MLYLDSWGQLRLILGTRTNQYFIGWYRMGKEHVSWLMWIVGFWEVKRLVIQALGCFDVYSRYSVTWSAIVVIQDPWYHSPPRASWYHGTRQGPRVLSSPVSFLTWGFPEMEVPQNWMFIMGNLTKINDLGVPPFQEMQAEINDYGRPQGTTDNGSQEDDREPFALHVPVHFFCS